MCEVSSKVKRRNRDVRKRCGLKEDVVIRAERAIDDSTGAVDMIFASIVTSNIRYLARPAGVSEHARIARISAVDSDKRVVLTGRRPGCFTRVE
ncbi:hypothetical protein EVAR_91570_1 [Eumeta japonica]|uniref:Uncharacterized protein n=1 Tax=Eumeta variegata TaxID=151549 RepID=A0A4C1X8Z4_EUMVA|nr:hypothetical protein EVAR_91570_1 [Eumeta japonica]